MYFNSIEGFEAVAELETGGSYEFDTTLVLKKNDGRFFWVHDSGCSCPIPFENVSCEADLTPLNSASRWDESWKAFESFVMEQYDGAGVGRSGKAKFLDEVESIIGR